MDPTEIRARMRQVEERYGGWTADNIRLAEGLYTCTQPRKNQPGKPYTGHEGVDPRVRRFVQVVADLAGQSLDQLRILDLGPLEGIFSIEFALHGAEVLAIEGREANLEKVRFTKEVFGLEKLHLVLDDIRNLCPDKHGSFDVVLCSGVLYHLDAPSLYPFMERVAKVCKRFALIDSHLSLVDAESFTANGHTYWGRTVVEHEPESSEAERLAQVWQSVDNPTSFHLTRASLYNLLHHVGFTSVFECHRPTAYVLLDRNAFVAFKGRRETVHTNPLLNEPEGDSPEKIAWSEPPWKGAEVFGTYGELLERYQKLQDQYDVLREEHVPFSYLSGTLRQLPRLFWNAVRRRLRGESTSSAR